MNGFRINCFDIDKSESSCLKTDKFEINYLDNNEKKTLFLYIPTKQTSNISFLNNLSKENELVVTENIGYISQNDDNNIPANEDNQVTVKTFEYYSNFSADELESVTFEIINKSNKTIGYFVLDYFKPEFECYEAKPCSLGKGHYFGIEGYSYSSVYIDADITYIP